VVLGLALVNEIPQDSSVSEAFKMEDQVERLVQKVWCESVLFAPSFPFLSIDIPWV
jgi:hypothetical protein